MLVRGRSYWTGLAVCAAVTVPIVLALRSSLAIDEFLYLHWSYKASQGVFAGTDYFACHFAFLQMIFAPLFWLVQGAPERAAFLARAVCALMAVGSLYFATLLYRRMSGGKTAWSRFETENEPFLLLASAAVAAGFFSFSTRLMEVRPDNLAIFCLLGSLACLPQKPHRLRSLLAGALAGCAVLSSEKMLLPIAILLSAQIIVLLAGGASRTRTLSQVFGVQGRGCILGFLGFIVFGVCLLAKFEFDRFFGNLWALVDFIRLHETAYPRRGNIFDTPNGRGFIYLVLSCCIALVVLWLVTLSKTRKELGWRRLVSLPLSPSYGALLIAGVLIYALQKAPYAYSRSLLFVMGAPLIADAVIRGLASLFSLGRKGERAIQVVLYAAVFVSSGVGLHQADSRVLKQQMTTLSELRQLTTADDCVYDNSMGAFFREHAHSYFVSTDAMLKKVKAQELATQIPSAILQAGCVAMLVDIRQVDLPRSLALFLQKHFSPVSPHLYLYSSFLETTSEKGVYAFFAPQTSWYSVVAPQNGQVRTLADAPWSYRLWLKRGPNRLLASNPGIRLLWQPRDGLSKPAYTGPMDIAGFSHL